MRKENYKEKGITLIALVITIIILLILAGVTLTTALGQNGLFERAKYAGEKYKESEADEAEKLEEVEKDIDKIIDRKDPTISDPQDGEQITFYVSGDQFTVKKGTTWKEWCEINNKFRVGDGDYIVWRR